MALVLSPLEGEEQGQIVSEGLVCVRRQMTKSYDMGEAYSDTYMMFLGPWRGLLFLCSGLRVSMILNKKGPLLVLCPWLIFYTLAIIFIFGKFLSAARGQS